MKILFLGSPLFAKNVLECLYNAQYEIVAVVCQPDRKADRGGKIHMPEAKMFALEKGIKVLQFEKVNQHIEEIKKLDFDLFVTASFGQILSREFLNLGFGINVHPSLLPDLRGATPIQTALMQNRKFTGVSIQRMVYEMDAGDIIESKKIEIDDEDDYLSLETKLSNLSCELVLKALNKIKNKSVVFHKQIGEPTFTKLIKKEDGLLNFHEEAEKLFGKVRAIAHNPGCFFFLDNNRIKVLKAKVIEKVCDENTVLNEKKRFVIGCKSGALEILELISPNGKKMNGSAFLNGYHGLLKVNDAS